MADNEKTQTANEIAESLFDAVSLIFDSKAADLTYDKTISCTIEDITNAANGEYVVSDGQSQFKAYSSNTGYTKGLNVYVTIPGNDMLNQKLIVGKVSSTASTDLEPYVSPVADMVDITGNLVQDSTIGDSLLANCPNSSEDGKDNLYSKVAKVIWGREDLDIKGLTRLGVKAGFSSWISSAVSGNYGLQIEIVGTQLNYYAEGSMIKSREIEGKITVKLDSSEMYGNPYNYSSYYTQEKVFDISNFQTIEGIKITFYQSQNFYDTNGKLLAYCYSTDTQANAGLLGDNLYVNGLEVTMGYALTDYTEDTLLVGTLEDQTYASNQDDNESGTRSLYARWIKLEDNKPYAIDDWSEAPEDIAITWFKYEENSTCNDLMAGNQWRQLTEDSDDVVFTDGGFNITVKLDKTLSQNKYKAILENPSLTSRYDDLFFENESVIRASNYLVSLLYKDYKPLYNDFYQKLFTRNSSFSSYEDVEDYLTQTNYELNGETYDVKTIFQDQTTLKKSDEFLTKSDDTNYLSSRLSYFKQVYEDILDDLGATNYLASAELIFTNQKDTVSSATSDAIKGLTIVCDKDGSNGVFKMYDPDDGEIVKPSQLKTREFEAQLSLSTTEETSLIRAEYIQWKIPKKDTLIYYHPNIDTTKDSTESIQQPQITEDEDYYTIVRKGTEDYTSEDTQIWVYQDFQIAEQYVESYTNNTIYCEVKKNGIVWNAEYTLTFGVVEDPQAGITGSIALYKSNDKWEQQERTTFIDIDTTNAATNNYLAVLTLYDNNKTQITLDPEKIKWSWYPYNDADDGDIRLSLGNLTDDQYNVATESEKIGLWARDKIIISQWADNTQKDKFAEARLTTEEGIPCFGGYNYYILQAEYQYTEDLTIRKLYPIPLLWAMGGNLSNFGQSINIDFDPTIYYNSAGTDPEYNKDEIQVTNENIDTFYILDNTDTYNFYGIASFEETNDWQSNEESSNTLSANAFYPTVQRCTNSDGKITGLKIKPYDLYMSNLSNILSIYFHFFIGKEFSQSLQCYVAIPIIIGIENQILSQWNGDLTVDKDTGTILAAMVGAGRKESDNTFSGVLMGDVNDKVKYYSKSENYTEYEDTGVRDIGLYGYYHGEQSYAFKSDGTAFIGRSGAGRIEFDGNNGIIQNATYEKNNTGMRIDLGGYSNGSPTDPSIKLYGAAGGIEMSTAGSLDDTSTGGNADAFFVIKARNEITKKDTTSFKTLMKVGTSDYFLQTYNYKSGEAGVKIDLKNGKIDAYDFQIKAAGGNGTITIDSSATDYPLSIIGSNNSGNNYFKVGWNGVLEAQGGLFNGGQIKGGSIEIGTDPDIFQADSNGIRLGKYIENNQYKWKFSVSNTGSLNSIDGVIGGWIIKKNYLISIDGYEPGSSTTGKGIILAPAGYEQLEAGIYLGPSFTIETLKSSGDTTEEGQTVDSTTSSGVSHATATGKALFAADVEGNCAAKNINCSTLSTQTLNGMNPYWGKITQKLKAGDKDYIYSWGSFLSA